MPYFRPLFVMGKPSLVPMGYARVLLLPGPGWGLVGAPGGKKHMGIVHEAHAHLEEHRRREAEQPLQGSRGDKKGKGGRRKMEGVCWVWHPPAIYTKATESVAEQPLGGSRGREKEKERRGRRVWSLASTRKTQKN